ncbi:GtrA family protein [Tabrizicola sp. J26]|uniref:GtrA family protein n=1 Tax=Alitabrizicola rongguiensis TaxID=2909234 RepID=UPI001F28A6A2|nr:GtrA family protein [Tabrizicola rongguiensis]MCF1711114.1 GtrA family protein [Tabrizicola rongguiensis]
MLSSRHGALLQFVLYLFVGGISFLVDLAVFIALLPHGYVLALIPGFLAGTITNYILSRLVAFRGGRRRFVTEFAMLATVAATGAGMTILLVLGMVHLGLSPLVAKIVATPLILAWNFLLRRHFVFSPQLPRKVQNFIGDEEGSVPRGDGASV